MPLIFYTMLALVQEFLPHMLEQGDGAILTAQSGSIVQGLPNVSGPSPARAAQHNYLQALQALHAEVADKGVYVGVLYVAADIKNSAFTPRWRRTKLRATRSGRCLPPTLNISPTCSGPCAARRDSGKPSIRSIADRVGLQAGSGAPVLLTRVDVPTMCSDLRVACQGDGTGLLPRERDRLAS
jgi:NAD(P)-dependent dehydrogenase (short-subunit alcohol dehydrogenase family)